MPEKKYDTPLVKKLGIKPSCRLLIVNGPADFHSKLIGLPDDVVEGIAEDESADVIVWCCDEEPGFEPSRPQDRRFVGNIV